MTVFSIERKPTLEHLSQHESLLYGSRIEKSSAHKSVLPHEVFPQIPVVPNAHLLPSSSLYERYKRGLISVQKLVPGEKQERKNAKNSTLQKITTPFVSVAKRVAFFVQRIFQDKKISIQFFSTLIDDLKICNKITPEQHKKIADLLARNNTQESLYSLFAYLNFSSLNTSFVDGHTLMGSLEIIYTWHLLEKLTTDPSISTVLSNRDKRKLPRFNLSDRISEKSLHSQLQQLSSIYARKKVYDQLNTLGSFVGQDIPEETQLACITALQENDLVSFTQHISSFLNSIEKELPTAETLYAKELLHFFSTTPSFEDLSNEISLQSYIENLAQTLSSTTPQTPDLISQIDQMLTFAALQPICATHQAAQKGSIAKARRCIQEDGIDHHVLFLTSPEDRRQKDLVLQNILPSHTYTFSTRHLEQKSSDTTPKIEQIRRLLLQERPDCINLLSCPDVSTVAAVAKQLGIPVINISAGFDMRFDWDSDLSFDMKTIAPSTQDPIANSTIDSTVKKDDIEQIGLLVGHEFEKAYSPEELSTFRQKLSISPEQKVVVISCEDNSKPDLIEKLVSDYTDKQPLHIVALCSDQYQERSIKEKVKKRVSKKPQLQLSTQSKINEKEEALLANIADLYITKPSEQKILQLYKAGTRTILDQRSPSHILNSNVIVSRGRADILTHTHRLGNRVKKEVQQPRHRRDAISQINASERYTDLVTTLLANRGNLFESWYQE